MTLHWYHLSADKSRARPNHALTKNHAKALKKNLTDPNRCMPMVIACMMHCRSSMSRHTLEIASYLLQGLVIECKRRSWKIQRLVQKQEVQCNTSMLRCWQDAWQCPSAHQEGLQASSHCRLKAQFFIWKSVQLCAASRATCLCSYVQLDLVMYAALAQSSSCPITEAQHCAKEHVGSKQCWSLSAQPFLPHLPATSLFGIPERTVRYLSTNTKQKECSI